jgi:hypothetical protein
MAVTVDGPPARALADEPFTVVLTGLRPRGDVTIEVRLDNCLGRAWHGTFRANADAAGVLDLATVALTGFAEPDPTASFWLTGKEIASLDEKEKILRILVRSVPRDASAPTWPTAIEEANGLLSPYADDAKAVVAAFRRNAEVSEMNPRYTTHNLRADRIRDHVAAKWGLKVSDRLELNAAAMDRGFAHTDHAINTARSFFLSVSGAY